MQLTYLINILQDYYNIVPHRFETDPVNLMKNRSLVEKKLRKFQYILAWLILSEKTCKLSLGTTTFKSFVSHTSL